MSEKKPTVRTTRPKKTIQKKKNNNTTTTTVPKPVAAVKRIRKKYETLDQITNNALKAGKAKRLSFKAGVEECSKNTLALFGRTFILDILKPILETALIYKGDKIIHLRPKDVRAALHDKGYDYYGIPKHAPVKKSHLSSDPLMEQETVGPEE